MNSLSRLTPDISSSVRERFRVSGNLDIGHHASTRHQRSEVFTEDLQAEVVLQWLTSKVKVSKIQEFIFVETWHGQTYQQTAEKNRYNYSYIKDAGHKLWRKLSALLDENITKHNCRTVISTQYIEKAQTLTVDGSKTPDILDDFILSKEKFDSGRHVLEKSLTISSFRGRGKELSTLIEWIALQRLKLIGVFGLAGCGKTTLVAKAVESVRKYFDVVIWRSLRDSPDFHGFMSSILSHFSDHCSSHSEDETNYLVSCLLEQCEKSRVLLVLDDWSSVFTDDALAGIYRPETEKYGLLLRRLSESSHDSCVVITSREVPSGLVFKQRDASPLAKVQYLFMRGLASENGYDALADFGLTQQDSAAMEKLLHYYSGNPYALRIAVNTICSLFGEDVTYFLTQQNLIYGEIKSLLERQLRRISALEKEIMLDLVQRSEEVSLFTLISKASLPINAGSRLEALESLLNRGFISRENETFKAPTIIKNYLTHYPSELA